MLRTSFFFSPISSHKDVATDLGPHGVPGALCSSGSHSDVPFSVAAEVLLVPLMQECVDCVHWWLLGKRWSLGVPLQVPPSLLLFTDASLTGCGAHLLDLTLAEV